MGLLEWACVQIKKSVMAEPEAIASSVSLESEI